MYEIRAFFDKATFTLTYVVWDPKTQDALLIDPVTDYDQAASQISYQSVDQLEEFIRSQNLKLHLIVETHAHADHVSGSQELKKRFNAPIAIGENIRLVQETFQPIFGIEISTDGSQFDRLLKDNEEVKVGSILMKVLFTPGHTPACASYLIGDAVFTGDALFLPDYGTGRCDFPKGDAKALYHSIHDRLYALPDSTRVFVGHDYQPGGRDVQWETTIGASKQSNIQLRQETSEAEYVKFRTTRDKTLSAPKLLLPSVQINIDAGRVPDFLKIPIRT